MSPEKTRGLFKHYPRLYRGRDRQAGQSSMPIGFECGDGWFGLIDGLARAIGTIAAKEKVRPNSEAWAVQVKQEAGALRFHLVYPSAAYTQRIDEAIAASMHTCDVCGRDDAKAVHYRRFSKILSPAHDGS
jgi:hypothetical protein